MIGIYMITNAITGARYIGKSVDVERRFMEHKTPNSSLKTKSPQFVEDIKRFGIDSFRFEILEECQRSELKEKELAWIRKIQPEYNTIGKRVPQHIRDVLREHGKRQWAAKSDAEKQKVLDTQLIGPKKGHPVHQKTREKLRAANLGTSRFSVRIVETGQVFKSADECARALGCTRCTVYNQLQGRTKNLMNGYHLERVETNRDECSGVGRG